jgi:hypothetical protein
VCDFDELLLRMVLVGKVSPCPYAFRSIYLALLLLLPLLLLLLLLMMIFWSSSPSPRPKPSSSLLDFALPLSIFDFF